MWIAELYLMLRPNSHLWHPFFIGIGHENARSISESVGGPFDGMLMAGQEQRIGAGDGYWKIGVAEM